MTRQVYIYIITNKLLKVLMVKSNTKFLSI